MQLSQQHQAQNVTSLFSMLNLLQFEVKWMPQNGFVVAQNH